MFLKLHHLRILLSHIGISPTILPFQIRSGKGNLAYQRSKSLYKTSVPMPEACSWRPRSILQTFPSFMFRRIWFCYFTTRNSLRQARSANNLHRFTVKLDKHISFLCALSFVSRTAWLWNLLPVDASPFHPIFQYFPVLSNFHWRPLIQT